MSVEIALSQETARMFDNLFGAGVRGKLLNQARKEFETSYSFDQTFADNRLANERHISIGLYQYMPKGSKIRHLAVWRNGQPELVPFTDVTERDNTMISVSLVEFSTPELNLKVNGITITRPNAPDVSAVPVRVAKKFVVALDGESMHIFSVKKGEFITPDLDDRLTDPIVELTTSVLMDTADRLSRGVAPMRSLNKHWTVDPKHNVVIQNGTSYDAEGNELTQERWAEIRTATLAFRYAKEQERKAEERKAEKAAPTVSQ